MRRSPEEREELLKTLDAAETVGVTLLRALLIIALFVILGVVVAAGLRYRPENNTQGEYFYLGIAVLLATGWILAQLASLRRRTARRVRPAMRMPEVEDSGAVPLEDGTGYTRSWQIRLGGQGEEVPEGLNLKGLSFSRSFEMPLTSLPAEIMPDDATLDRFAEGLERGEELEDLCRTVQPAYADWNLLARQAYRLLVEAKLEERRRSGG